MILAQQSPRDDAPLIYTSESITYRKTDGDDYEPDTLSGLQRSIQRLLSEGRPSFTVLSHLKGNW